MNNNIYLTFFLFLFFCFFNLVSVFLFNVFNFLAVILALMFFTILLYQLDH